MKRKSLIEETGDFFGVLYSYVCDDDITDIDYNGQTLWLTYSDNYRKCAKDIISDDFVEQFSARVSNAVSKPFNKQYPVLEAETDFLRITIVHESVAMSGRTFCIRKSLPSVRLTEQSMISSGFCTREMLEFLKSSIKEKKNIVFCGEPGAGKTECAKFFSKYIDKEERVITIEDNAEWHYSMINEGKDCIELKVNDIVDYSKAIKTCLRLNPKWIMLSEVRSSEVIYLLECFSTGVRGITTIHTDDVRKIPDRMLNMAGRLKSSNMENDIYSFIDVGVLVKRCDVKENGRHYAKRHIEQICTFSRENRENNINLKEFADTNDSKDYREKASVWKGEGTYYEKKEVI
ncbi:MAG TPA: pilus assembly protein [Lachnospiraceae bacterium]|nr:pilus assembly protein [Lachnospiraceae bacterium]